MFESLLSLYSDNFANVLFFVCCCLQPWWSNKSNFVLCLVALCSLSTRWLRGSKIHLQQDSTQDSKVYTTVVFFFFIFNVCVLAHCLGFNQNMLQYWFMWTCCTWFSFNYQEEALCWYCMSRQLVSTWCEFNDLLRFFKNVLQGSLGLVNKMERADFTNRKEPIWI